MQSTEKDTQEDQIIRDLEEEEDISEPSEESNPLSSLQLTWKSWYWYFLMLFNLCVPALMALDRLTTKDNDGTNSTSKLIFLCLFCPIIFTFLIIYMHYSLKNYRDCQVLIKESRIKNFWRGVTASFTSFCLLLIALTVSYKVGASPASPASIVVYTLMGCTFILGTASSAFISIFEFCVSFDIFYSKNKETIIEQALKYRGIFKIEDKEQGQEDNED